ncbi:MAG: hypothetical protein ISQ74_05460 [Puniceicoccaceae bacterium]|nr:hypothetical protein [Puniceicoccaceae bacterium]
MQKIRTPDTYWKTILLVAGILPLLLSGCRTLAPIDLPDEVAYPPAQSKLWETLSQQKSNDNWVALLNTGKEAIDWRLRLIDSATQSIDLQTFLWFNDQIGLAVLHHLFLAADRGVRVRILLDDSLPAPMPTRSG